jgi:carbon monoxide dehydrogenase subunit G
MSCYNTLEINVSPNKVWETIANFHDMSWAPEVIASVEAVGDKKGGDIGAKRILNGAFYETLTSVDSDKLTFFYSIDDGPGPVAKEVISNYIGVVKLSASENGTLVEWGSTFDAANEGDVVEFCDPIYQALLAALKQTLEKK